MVHTMDTTPNRRSQSVDKSNKPVFKYQGAYNDTIKTSQRQLYAVAFHQQIKTRNIFATVGGDRANVYEAVKISGKSEANPIHLLQSYRDPNNEERLYTCVWTCINERSYLLTAGETGVIRMIDIKLQGHAKQFTRHGNSINELQIHPRHPDIMLSASKDQSVRLWNINKDICIAVFGGQYGHFDEVLSVDFSLSGDCFISCGMDHQLMVWEIEPRAGTKLIAQNDLEKEIIDTDITPFTSEQSISSAIDKSFRHDPILPFTTINVATPVFSTNEVHGNYVDTVKFLNKLVISKSCENFIEIWKPCMQEKSLQRPMFLKSLKMINADIWFMKMALSNDKKLVASGTCNGSVFVWNLTSQNPNGTRVKLDYPDIKSSSRYDDAKAVRQVAFSPDGQTLISVHDNSTLVRWDQVAAK